MVSRVAIALGIALLAAVLAGEIASRRASRTIWFADFNAFVQAASIAGGIVFIAVLVLLLVRRGSL